MFSVTCSIAIARLVFSSWRTMFVWSGNFHGHVCARRRSCLRRSDYSSILNFDGLVWTNLNVIFIHFKKKLHLSGHYIYSIKKQTSYVRRFLIVMIYLLFLHEIMFYFIFVHNYIWILDKAFNIDFCLFNLHVAICDNDNVVTDEVKLINK
jgi:hypothetical protein